jgi:uncharacterized protein (TIGR02246 family)
MKGIVIGIATVVLGANLAWADAQQDVLAVEKKFIDAQKTCNVAELNTVVADDMQFIHVGGNTQDKAAFVAGVGMCALSNLTLDVTKVRLYGDTAVLQGTQVHTLKNGTSGTLIVSQVYVKQNGAWKFASHQSTAPAAPPAAKK